MGRKRPPAASPPAEAYAEGGARPPAGDELAPAAQGSDGGPGSAAAGEVDAVTVKRERTGSADKGSAAGAAAAQDGGAAAATAEGGPAEAAAGGPPAGGAAGNVQFARHSGAVCCCGVAAQTLQAGSSDLRQVLLVAAVEGSPGLGDSSSSSAGAGGGARLLGAFRRALAKAGLVVSLELSREGGQLCVRGVMDRCSEAARAVELLDGAAGQALLDLCDGVSDLSVVWGSGERGRGPVDPQLASLVLVHCGRRRAHPQRRRLQQQPPQQQQEEQQLSGVQKEAKRHSGSKGLDIDAVQRFIAQFQHREELAAAERGSLQVGAAPAHDDDDVDPAATAAMGHGDGSTDRADADSPDGDSQVRAALRWRFEHCGTLHSISFVEHDSDDVGVTENRWALLRFESPSQAAKACEDWAERGEVVKGDQVRIQCVQHVIALLDAPHERPGAAAATAVAASAVAAASAAAATTDVLPVAAAAREDLNASPPKQPRRTDNVVKRTRPGSPETVEDSDGGSGSSGTVSLTSLNGALKRSKGGDDPERDADGPSPARSSASSVAEVPPPPSDGDATETRKRRTAGKDDIGALSDGAAPDGRIGPGRVRHEESTTAALEQLQLHQHQHQQPTPAIPEPEHAPAVPAAAGSEPAITAPAEAKTPTAPNGDLAEAPPPAGEEASTRVAAASAADGDKRAAPAEAKSNPPASHPSNKRLLAQMHGKQAMLELEQEQLLRQRPKNNVHSNAGGSATATATQAAAAAAGAADTDRLADSFRAAVGFSGESPPLKPQRQRQRQQPHSQGAKHKGHHPQHHAQSHYPQHHQHQRRQRQRPAAQPGPGSAPLQQPYYQYPPQPHVQGHMAPMPMMGQPGYYAAPMYPPMPPHLVGHGWGQPGHAPPPGFMGYQIHPAMQYDHGAFPPSPRHHQQQLQQPQQQPRQQPPQSPPPPPQNQQNKQQNKKDKSTDRSGASSRHVDQDQLGSPQEKRSHAQPQSPPPAAQQEHQPPDDNADAESVASVNSHTAPLQISRLFVTFQRPIPEELLREHFAEAAPGLEYVSRPRDKTFVFVKYTSEAAARLAMLRLKGKELIEGCPLKISIAQPPRQPRLSASRKRQRTSDVNAVPSPGPGK